MATITQINKATQEESSEEMIAFSVSSTQFAVRSTAHIKTGYLVTHDGVGAIGCTCRNGRKPANCKHMQPVNKELDAQRREQEASLELAEAILCPKFERYYADGTVNGKASRLAKNTPATQPTTTTGLSSNFGTQRFSLLK